VLLVEQNVKQALRIAGRVYVMKVGQISLEDRAEALLERRDLWTLF
jgi:ABC-type branched-subunit amino acid transport system ATPase component